MSTEVTSHPNHDSAISTDDWLRGYFAVNDAADLRDAQRSSRGKRKNVDFLRLRDVGLHLLAPARGKRILDIGCADGATMVYCGLQGATISGIDLDSVQVAKANSQLKRFGLEGEAVPGDASCLPFPDSTFDGVISSDFVEHITDETKVLMLKEARRVLKPGAPLVTKTPNLSYLELSLAYKRLRAITRGRNPIRLVIPHTPGTDDPQHIGLTTHRAFARCLIAAGFLNYEFAYAPLRRFGHGRLIEILSTELPFIRDLLCEDIFCRAYKPIVMSHFPD